MAKILEIKNLNFAYAKQPPLFKNFNLEVEEGQYIGIAGNNNSGKTTLIKIISGILPSKNNIIIGYSYCDNNKFHEYSKEIGVVLSSNITTFLFEDVYKEMVYPLENLNVPVEQIEKRVLDISFYFGISKLLDKKTSDLTSSEKQELLLVISLLHGPKILLLDNAFSQMNQKTKNRMKTSLKKYQQENKLTIILTTTNLEDIIDTDYSYILDKGNIVMEEKPLILLKEERLLNKLGFKLPFIVDLSLKLQFYELLEDIEIDMNRMVDILWK